MILSSHTSSLLARPKRALQSVNVHQRIGCTRATSSDQHMQAYDIKDHIQEQDFEPNAPD